MHAVLVSVFFTVQATAIAHEVQHVLHQHDGPCGLHVAADHLVMAAAPEAAPAVALAPAIGLTSPSPDAPLELPAPPSGARAPPISS